MEFQDILNQYINKINCSLKELAEQSGLSQATVSRYHTGERTPKTGTGHLEALAKGIEQLAEDKHIKEIQKATILADFSKAVNFIDMDMKTLQTNLDSLLKVLPISVSELAKNLNYDASYISRIRNGHRTPADPKKFASELALFITRRYFEHDDKVIFAKLMGCKVSEIETSTDYLEHFLNWLTSGSGPVESDISNFLKKLNEFDLDEYIRLIHFDELKVPSVPFLLPTSKSYFGLKQMMDADLDFLKATVLSKSQESVIMYSDMPIAEMAKDPEFPKKWMYGMAMMLKKGLHLHQIHHIDRSFEEMMLGLESWIPMYMTGQISPYYFRGKQNSVFSHLLKVSGSAALTGEAISGNHSEGKYYLTKNKQEVSYYKTRAKRMLSKATPLMDIYRQDSENIYHTFLQADAKTVGTRRTILSSLPLYTAEDELIKRILCRNKIPKEEQNRIIQHISEQRILMEEILSHDTVTDEIPKLSQGEFERYPMTLSLSGIFYETDILYSYEEYTEHLRCMERYEQTHTNYSAKCNHVSAFRNIQIFIHEGSWVMVSKNKTPSIHFVICHPKMRNAIENMVFPIVEENRFAEK